MRPRVIRLRQLVLCGLILTLGGQACSLSSIKLPEFVPGLPSPSPSTRNSQIPIPMAQTTFVATIPEPLLPGEVLILNTMDEVTGLSLNALSYSMTARDELTYTAVLPLALDSVIKYRYTRQSTNLAVEDTNSGKPIRYRIYSVKGPGEVQDVIADWSDREFARGTGTIQGRILNADTGTPLPNLMITAGGQQYITDSAGRFELTGLATGTQNLVVYALDGLYQTFQQGAVVGPGQTTNVELQIKPVPMVNVTFEVKTPMNTVPGAPVRIAGNLLQLGNTFADLQGGMSVCPDRMPVLSLSADGGYSTTISLPVGAYVQYKYSLGDGFWNAEHKTSGEFMLRELVVPNEDLLIKDAVQTWQAGPSSPILFEVQVPSVTPPGDIIYIQFNPYGWTEPVPMWPLGDNKWAYKLYSPLNMLGSFGYRYCRNGQCGHADELQISGSPNKSRTISTSLTAQDIQDSVTGWRWFDTPEATTLVGSVINARAAGFKSAVEFQSSFQPNWSYYMPYGLANAQALGANEIVYTPSWSYQSASPLLFTPLPGRDPLWIDSAIMISQARALGLEVAIFPTPHFVTTAMDFWTSAARDAGWWQDWFDHYRAFAVNYADLASQTGAQTLILGGDEVSPALPGGILPDGSANNLPGDVETKWKSVISEVRQHFNGQLLWALPFERADPNLPISFLQDSDGLYILWYAPLAENSGADKADLVEEAGRLLDNEISPLSSLINKPVYIAIAYPSAVGADQACVPDGEGSCLPWSDLNQPDVDTSSSAIDLQLQADIYESMLNAVNARPWVAGVISRGFYPPAALQDPSASVHGKPAADILWYWFPRLTGAVK